MSPVYKGGRVSPACTSCNDTGVVRWRVAVDEYEQAECPDCPPPLVRKPVEAPRKLDQFDIKPTVGQLVQRLDKYLSMKNTNTWPPEQFSVADDDRREDAIDWFVDLCIKLGIVEVSMDDPRRVIP